MIDLEKIKTLLQEDNPAAALALFDGEEQLSADGYFLRGKIYWRMGLRREAINDYHASVALMPDGPAARALEQANSVMSFFNPDLLNP